jgi:catechol 2,3-dioxygenase-like lactoylglutathione lyase family enzyme
MLQRVFHVNICVRDMERSIQFYQGLGFKKANDFTLNDPSVGDVLGMKAKTLRGVFMRLGDDANAPVLDLVQFIDPPTQEQPYPTLNNVGICRIAFTVDDIDKTYEELKAKGRVCRAAQENRGWRHEDQRVSKIQTGLFLNCSAGCKEPDRDALEAGLCLATAPNNRRSFAPALMA